MKPRSGVQEWVTTWGKALHAAGVIEGDLGIEYNPDWCEEYRDPETLEIKHSEDPSMQFFITRRTLRVAQVDGVDGLAFATWEDYPILYVPSAVAVDRRWVDALEESYLPNFKERLARWFWDQDEKKYKERKDFARQMARDLYPFARKHMDYFGVANEPDHDPTYKRKEWEDKHGRRWHHRNPGAVKKRK